MGEREGGGRKEGRKSSVTSKIHIVKWESKTEKAMYSVLLKVEKWVFGTQETCNGDGLWGGNSGTRA